MVRNGQRLTARLLQFFECCLRRPPIDIARTFALSSTSEPKGNCALVSTFLPPLATPCLCVHVRPVAWPTSPLFLHRPRTYVAHLFFPTRCSTLARILLLFASYPTASTRFDTSLLHIQPWLRRKERRMYTCCHWPTTELPKSTASTYSCRLRTRTVRITSASRSRVQARYVVRAASG